MWKKVQLLGLVLLVLGLESPGRAVLRSPIFSHEHTEQAKGLSISLQGEGWEMRQTKCFTNFLHTEIIETTGNIRGISPRRNLSFKEFRHAANIWVRRLERGRPDVYLAVSETQTSRPLGCIIINVGNKLGLAELEYYFIPEFWEKSAQSIFRAMAELWAPEVNRIGHGIDLNKNDERDKKIKEAFQCFRGDGQIYPFSPTPLKCLETFVLLSYEKGWELFDNCAFSAAPVSEENQGILANFSEETIRSDAFEIQIIERFYSSQESALKPGTRYRFIDPQGCLRTFSRHPVNLRICYHFEFDIEKHQSLRRSTPLLSSP